MKNMILISILALSSYAQAGDTKIGCTKNSDQAVQMSIAFNGTIVTGMTLSRVNVPGPGVFWLTVKSQTITSSDTTFTVTDNTTVAISRATLNGQRGTAVVNEADWYTCN